jgi:ADP-dependent NAD(P)H-hydrate dehydratase / NAD(P)H-hydrate epimerase
MLRAHTVEQIRAAEEPLMAGLPEDALMQRAAHGLAYAVLDFLGRGYGARVLLLVGAGSNGGDALHAGAALARRGCSVEAVLLAPERVHRTGLAALLAAAGRVVEVEETRRPDVVVDGIVGIGARGGLRDEAVAALDAVRGAPIVAVDVPSGVDVDTGEAPGPHVEAALTVTFGTHRVAHLVDPAATACGAVHLVDIGLTPPEAGVEALQAEDVARLVEPPAPDAHKYSRGVVGVRAGSERYPGAAVLSVAGAGCGLAGMVRYDGSAAGQVLAAHPETVPGPGRVQAWVVGSGGGDDAAEALDASVADAVPVVVDADALAGLNGALKVPAVLTPHAGELARLLGTKRGAVEAAPLRHAREAAERYAAVVLLKGRRTLVAEPGGRVRVNTTGVPWLATAGAGDVLGGVVGALLAGGLEPFDAASAGAWLHGAAATLASAGGPLRAGQVAEALPAAVRAAHRSADAG